MIQLNRVLCLVVVIATLAISHSVIAGCETCPKDVSDKMFGALKRPGNAGTEFYLTFLPCYNETGGNNKLMIYVASQTRTRVRVEIEAKGYVMESYSLPNDIIAFVFDPGGAQAYLKSAYLEAPPEQVYRAVGIHITAGAPVVVYGVTRFNATSDSFLALPLQTLGKEYIVSMMADMSKMYTGYNLPSEVAIVGSYPGTMVTFTCGGPDVTTSSGGLKPGQTTSFTLNPGDVWVIANSISSKEGDFSGSRIVASKPVGVFSGNQCANVPTTLRWCDFNCEMEIPTSLWGKHYLLPKNANRKNGYFMKVQAAKANTHIDYNGSFWKLLQTSGGQEGTGWIYQRADPEGNYVVHLDSDCPIDVMVFNPGQEDDNVQTDPYQMVVYPVEQFQRYANFCTPGYKGGTGFSENYMGLVFQLDTLTGTMPKDLEFGIEQNGKIVWRQLSLVFGPSIASRDIYKGTVFGKRYAFKECVLGSGGFYAMRCGTPFGCYVYGGDSFDSYGHPATGAFVGNGPTGCDTIPPVPKYVVDCDGSVGVQTSATITDMPNDDGSRSNLSTIFLDPDSSSNYTLSYDGFIAGEARQTKWRITVDDPEQDAVARVIFSDRAGNDTTITIRYFAVKLAMSNDVNFGLVKKGSTTVLTTDLVNNTSKTQTIKKLFFRSSQTTLSSNGVFRIISPIPPFDLAPGASITIRISYDATVDGLLRDSIGVATDCFTKIKRLVMGEPGVPVISVSDIAFGSQVINTTSAPRTFVVSNTGKVTLNVSGHSALIPDDKVFDISDVTSQGISASNPLILQAAGSSANTKSFAVTFHPTALQNYSATLTFSSDARTIDSVCVLSGTCIGPGLRVNSVAFGRKRVRKGPYLLDQDNIVSEIVLSNSGSSDVRVDHATIQGWSAHPAAFTEVNGAPLDLSLFDNRIISAGAEFRRAFAYNPQATEFDSIVIAFINDSPDSVVFTATGTGVQPKVRTVDLSFGAFDLTKDVNAIQRSCSFSNLDMGTTPAWEFYDTLHIADLRDASASGQDDIAISYPSAYSTKGFAYDKSAVGLPLTLKPGESSTVFSGYYKPSAISPDDRATLRTLSDADTEAVSLWTGLATGGRLQYSHTPLSFNLCAGETQRVITKIRNTSAVDLSIDAPISVRFVNGNASLFRVVSLPANSIAPGEEADLVIEYLSLAPGDETIDCIIDAHAENSSVIVSDTIHITVHVFEYPATLNVGSVLGQNISATTTFFDVPIILSNNLDAAGVKGISFSIRFNPEVLFVKRLSTDNSKVSVIMNSVNGAARSWTADADYVIINATTAEIRCRLQGDVPLNGGDGQPLCRVSFQFILAGTNVSGNTGGIPIELSSISAYSDKELSRPNVCANIQPVSGTVNGYWLCAQDLRLVNVHTSTTAIVSVTPNPISSKGSQLSFSVGIDAPVRLQLINSLGQVIQTVVQDNLTSGAYNVSLMPTNIADGMYILKLRVGESVVTQSIVVQK